MPSTGRTRTAVVRARQPLLGVWLVVALLGLAGAATATPAAAAPAPAAPSVPDRAEPWVWPVEGAWGPFGPPPDVLRGFDPPAQVWLPGHRGVDLAAGAGATVVAAGAGVVVFAGPLAGRGVVSVAHDGGLRTTYEPVEALVVSGQRVSAGDLLGPLEPLTTHCGTTCLHWGLRRGEVYLDPLLLVDPATPVLLPYGPPVAAPAGG